MPARWLITLTNFPNWGSQCSSSGPSMAVTVCRQEPRCFLRLTAGGLLISIWTVCLVAFISSVSTGLTINVDIGEELRTSLVEEYANQKKPTDGEIYRKIRQYEGEDNEAFRERWLVRLSPSNQDRLDQLDNKRNRRLRRAFDRLLPIPGLWPHGVRISMLHRLIATGCVEVSPRIHVPFLPITILTAL